MGIDIRGYDVPKKPVFMRGCGYTPNCETVFATLLQHLVKEKLFATDEIVADGFAVN